MSPALSTPTAFRGRSLDLAPILRSAFFVSGRNRLVYDDWDAAIAHQGHAFTAVFQRLVGARPLSVVDVSCGIGGVLMAIVELKERNRLFGCPRIALIISRTFGIEIDKSVSNAVSGQMSA